MLGDSKTAILQSSTTEYESLTIYSNLKCLLFQENSMAFDGEKGDILINCKCILLSWLKFLLSMMLTNRPKTIEDRQQNIAEF